MKKLCEITQFFKIGLFVFFYVVEKQKPSTLGMKIAC